MLIEKIESIVSSKIKYFAIHACHNKTHRVYHGVIWNTFGGIRIPKMETHYSSL